MKIKEALAFLDPENDAHWTADGLPLVDAVASLIGKSVKRSEITDEAPMFTRDAARAAAGAGEDEDAEDVVGPDGEGEDLDGIEDGDGDVDGVDEELDESFDGSELDGDLADRAMGADAAATVGGGKGEGEGAGGKPAPSPEPRSVIDRYSVAAIMASPALAERAWEEIEARIMLVTRTRNEADAELKRLSGISELMSRIRARHTRANPNAPMDDIRSYLETSNRTRELRGRRLAAFLDSGIKPVELVDALRGSSKLDAAMARKTIRGGQRPKPRLMPHGAPQG